jgi:hypothetical protein
MDSGLMNPDEALDMSKWAKIGASDRGFYRYNDAIQ